MMAQSPPSIWTSSTALRLDRSNILRLPSRIGSQQQWACDIAWNVPLGSSNSPSPATGGVVVGTDSSSQSSELTAVGHRENNCVFRLRQSSGAQFYLFHSAAPNFKREPTATAVVGRKASREILTGSNAYPTSHV